MDQDSSPGPSDLSAHALDLCTRTYHPTAAGGPSKVPPPEGGTVTLELVIYVLIKTYTSLDLNLK